MVQHPVSYVIDGLSMTVGGVLYGVAFFTDALAPRAQAEPPRLG
jgi:hypothetical protein